jgi:hypothetical protein
MPAFSVARCGHGSGRPDPGVLLGVAHAGSTMWAVGYYYAGTGTGTEAGVQRTLIERYTC